MLYLYLTGFGPFNGVPINPTTLLMKELPKYLEKEKILDANSLHIEMIIIETSAIGSRNQLLQIINNHKQKYVQQNEIKENNNDDIVIFLHFGVSNREIFNLEQVAYNEATFRVADERGYKPHNQAILEMKSPDYQLCTQLNTNNLCDYLATKKQHPVTISHDAGRFVCNWIYCNSLYQCQLLNQQNNNNNAYYSIFIHVPSFKYISKEKQLKFIRDMIEYFLLNKQM